MSNSIHGSTIYQMPIETLIRHYEEVLVPDPISDQATYMSFYRDLRYRLDKGFLYEPISPETHAKCDAYAKKVIKEIDDSIGERIAELKAAQAAGVKTVTLSQHEIYYFCENDEDDDE